MSEFFDSLSDEEKDQLRDEMAQLSKPPDAPEWAQGYGGVGLWQTYKRNTMPMEPWPGEGSGWTEADWENFHGPDIQPSLDSTGHEIYEGDDVLYHPYNGPAWDEGAPLGEEPGVTFPGKVVQVIPEANGFVVQFADGKKETFFSYEGINFTRTTPEGGLDRASSWRLAHMERLGASVEELAKEQIEDLLGYQGEEGTGHRPPRADIAKMKEIYDLFEDAHAPVQETGKSGWGREEAGRKWDELYGLNQRQQDIVELYRHTLAKRRDRDAAFDEMVELLTRPDPELYLHAPGMDEAKAKQEIGQALKRYEGQNMPRLYLAIHRGLMDLIDRNPASYKLMPWYVKQVKEQFQNFLGGLGDWSGKMPAINPVSTSGFFNDPALGHLKDITVEAGDLLSKLRAENRLPQGMDVNKMDAREVEQWLMDWKRENRQSEAQGQVIYQWPDGYTMQRLTTPEQLQFEGDEMGHCVGGYAREVESGSTLIYSLRDGQGEPHATIEIHAQGPWKALHDKPVHEMTPEDFKSQMGADAPLSQKHQYLKGNVFPHLESDEDYQHYQQLRMERREDDPQVHQWYPHYFHSQSWVAPEQPEATGGDMYDRSGRPWKPEFEVVQVQGNSNQTPKPQYQAKIKEWMDSLRDKGVDFVRSDQWFANYDAEEPEGDDYIQHGNELDEWWEKYRNGGHSAYTGEGEDAYGMRKTPPDFDMDPEGVMDRTLAGMMDNNGRREWENSTLYPEQAAKAMYSALNLHFNKSHQGAQDWDEKNMAGGRSPKDYAQEKMQEVTEYGWDQLNDWIDQARDNNWEYLYGEAMQKYIDEGGEVEEQDEEGEVPHWQDPSTLHPVDEEKFDEARSEVESEYEMAEFGQAIEFLQHLSDLVHTVGPVHWSMLTDTRELPDVIKAAQWREKFEQPPSTIQMPGALSKVAEAAQAVIAPPMPDINNVLDYNPEDLREPGWHSGIRWSKDLEETGMRGPEDMDRYYSPQSVSWERARDWLLEKAREVASHELNRNFPPAHQLPALAPDTPYSWVTNSVEHAVQNYMREKNYWAEWFVEQMPGGYENR